MDRNAFLREVLGEKVKNIYIMEGQESYLKQLALNFALEKLISEDFRDLNITYFENPEINMISIGILEKYGYTKQSCIEAMKKGGNCGLINKNDYAAIKDDYIKAVDNKEDYNAIYRFELEQTTLWIDSKTKYLNTENGYRT